MQRILDFLIFSYFHFLTLIKLYSGFINGHFIQDIFRSQVLATVFCFQRHNNASFLLWQLFCIVKNNKSFGGQVSCWSSIPQCFSNRYLLCWVWQFLRVERLSNTIQQHCERDCWGASQIISVALASQRGWFQTKTWECMRSLPQIMRIKSIGIICPSKHCLCALWIYYPRKERHEWTSIFDLLR